MRFSSTASLLSLAAGVAAQAPVTGVCSWRYLLPRAAGTLVLTGALQQQGDAPVVTDNPAGVVYSATLPSTAAFKDAYPNGGGPKGEIRAVASPDGKGVMFDVTFSNLPPKELGPFGMSSQVESRLRRGRANTDLQATTCTSHQYRRAARTARRRWRIWTPSSAARTWPAMRPSRRHARWAT